VDLDTVTICDELPLPMRVIVPPSYPQLSLILHLQSSSAIEPASLEASTIDIANSLTLKYAFTLQKAVLKNSTQSVTIQIGEDSLTFHYMLFLFNVESKLAFVSATVGKDNFASRKTGKVELNEILSILALNAHLMGQTTLPSALHTHAFS
jgi:hypothetical protein